MLNSKRILGLIASEIELHAQLHVTGEQCRQWAREIREALTQGESELREAARLVAGCPVIQPVCPGTTDGRHEWFADTCRVCGEPEPIAVGTGIRNC
jgi:hypothetical protein